MKTPMLKDLIPFFCEFNGPDYAGLDAVTVSRLIDSQDFWYEQAWPRVEERGETFQKRWMLTLKDMLMARMELDRERCRKERDRGFNGIDYNLLLVLLANATSAEKWFALCAASDPHPVEYTEKLSKFGDMMTRQEWLDSVECGGLIDYDGHGHPAKDNLLAEMTICPSRAPLLPPDATHVQWYNK